MSLVHINFGFMIVAALLYLVFGGADFGAGILELCKSKQRTEDQRQLIAKAISPVWEANHVWLILIIVILFMAFPEAYAAASIYLHLPLIALLVGIVLRGTAFTFGHYDPIKGPAHIYYERVFAISSVWTAFFLGVLGATLHRGYLRSNGSYFELYVAPWIGLFPFVVGLFSIMLCGFVASSFLITEAKEDAELQDIFLRRSQIFLVLSIVIGALAFIVAYNENPKLLELFFGNSVSLLFFALATINLLGFPWVWKQNNPLLLRIAASSELSFIFLGWFTANYPTLMIVDGKNLDFLSIAAPEATQVQLLMALVVGSLLIFPALIFLFRVFKFNSDNLQ